jgi:hypothetical protein
MRLISLERYTGDRSVGRGPGGRYPSPGTMLRKVFILWT